MHDVGGFSSVQVANNVVNKFDLTCSNQNTKSLGSTILWSQDMAPEMPNESVTVIYYLFRWKMGLHHILSGSTRPGYSLLRLIGKKKCSCLKWPLLLTWIGSTINCVPHSDRITSQAKLDIKPKMSNWIFFSQLLLDTVSLCSSTRQTRLHRWQRLLLPNFRTGSMQVWW